MNLTFFGAARTVTGSMHHVEVNGRRYLLDCGLRQGKRQESHAINSEFPFDPATIDAVVLSHAHIDHSGNLPHLSAKGFKGPVHATPATRDLCEPMLKDSAHLQEKDAEFISKRRDVRKRLGVPLDGEPVPPLYSQEDAVRLLEQFEPLPLYERREIGPDCHVSLYNAGHMLGSACVLVEAEGKRLLFSGDVGRKGLPILKDPDVPPPADVLIMESTYGDRLHHDRETAADKLATLINATVERGGHIMVPAFAVGRTQQLVLLLHELIEAGRIPEIPMFVDSPLAIETTEVFRHHRDEYDEETSVFLKDGGEPFRMPRLKYLREAKESKALNELRFPFLVIAASGMCEAGRILHHLRNGVGDPRNLVLITGFQAENTLGRRLVERQREVRIFGEPYRVRCEVAALQELSGHADQRELLQWLKPIAKGLRQIYLVHGELPAMRMLAKVIDEEFGIPVTFPQRGDSFTV